MLKYGLLVFLFLFNIGTASAQYLKFGDFIELLELADDRNETEKFMKLNGFELSSFEYTDQEDDEDTSSYVMDFYQKMSGDEYYIRVVSDIDEDIFLIMEFSSNEDRSFYFASIISEAGLEPYKEWNNGGGDEGFEFESSDNYLTLAQEPDDNGAKRYRFTITNK
ncbi:MAG: hypothetical protein IH620_00010 [Ignavibacterium sp.]|nr:hypothetical protein [Ignavibacterium sp.]